MSISRTVSDIQRRKIA